VTVRCGTQASMTRLAKMSARTQRNDEQGKDIFAQGHPNLSLILRSRPRFTPIRGAVSCQYFCLAKEILSHVLRENQLGPNT
jgi:hypothetical protein